MAFNTQPAVKVTTTDSTGYIMEFISYSTLGPGGCVRVTTRDVWKLSAVNQTSNEIIPEINAISYPIPINPDVRLAPPSNGNGYYIKPIVVKAIEGPTNCLPGKTVGCVTDNVCCNTVSSQTEIPKSVDQCIGNSSDMDLTDNKNSKGCVVCQTFKNAKKKEHSSSSGKHKSHCKKIKKTTETNASSSSDATASKEDRVTLKKEKCTCHKSDSTEKKPSEMEVFVDSKKENTDLQKASENSEREEERMDCETKQKNNFLCTKCSSTNKEHKQCDTDDLHNEKQEESLSCTVCCNKSKQNCATQVEIIHVMYENNSNSKKACETSSTSCQTSNEISIMQIDDTDNSCTSSASTSYTTTDDSESSDGSSGSQCSCQKKKPKKSKKCDKSKSNTTVSMKSDVSMVSSATQCEKKKQKHKCCQSGPSKRQHTCCLACQYTKDGQSDGSNMSVVADSETNMDVTESSCSDSVQTTTILLKDECIQCLRSKCKNACVVTDETTKMEQCEGAQTISLSKSIKDFVTRYLWGDPICKNNSTQASGLGQSDQRPNNNTGCNQDQIVMRSECTNTQPSFTTKTSNTEMDVDDNLSSNSENNNNRDKRNDIKDHATSSLLKKKSNDKMDSNSGTKLSQSRSVVFNEEAAVFNEEDKKKEYIAVRPDSSDKPTERDYKLPPDSIDDFETYKAFKKEKSLNNSEDDDNISVASLSLVFDDTSASNEDEKPYSVDKRKVKEDKKAEKRNNKTNPVASKSKTTLTLNKENAKSKNKKRDDSDDDTLIGLP